MTSYKDAPTPTIAAGGANFAYRGLGPKTGVPAILLTHLAAVLDNWDPRVIDGIAAEHPVITFDNRGVGASTGRRRHHPGDGEGRRHLHPGAGPRQDRPSRLLHGRHDRRGSRRTNHSRPQADPRGTGPAGGQGIKNVTRISHLDTIWGLLTFQDPKQFLFFTRHPTDARRASNSWHA